MKLRFAMLLMLGLFVAGSVTDSLLTPAPVQHTAVQQQRCPHPYPKPKGY